MYVCMYMEVLHIICNMSTCDLSNMYALMISPWALGMHTYQALRPCYNYYINVSNYNWSLEFFLYVALLMFLREIYYTSTFNFSQGNYWDYYTSDITTIHHSLLFKEWLK